MRPKILLFLVITLVAFNLFSIQDVENNKEEILAELNLGVQQFLYLDRSTSSTKKQEFSFSEIKGFEKDSEFRYRLLFDEKEMNKFRKECKRNKREHRVFFDIYYSLSDEEDKVKDVSKPLKGRFFYAWQEITYVTPEETVDRCLAISGNEAFAIQVALNEYYKPCDEGKEPTAKEKVKDFFGKVKDLFKKNKDDYIITINYIHGLRVEDRGSFYRVYSVSEPGVLAHGFKCYIEKDTHNILWSNR
jgi:hypothetical protein